MVINLKKSISYHYGKFPPQSLDYAQLIEPLTKATDALSRYDQMLKNLHNNNILLAPLRNQEVISTSRMEGTISTLDEILEYEAQYGNKNDNTGALNIRTDVIETILYARSLNKTQQAIQDGQKLSPFLLRQAHQILLSFGRGENKNPGEFKTEQNYLADEGRRNILFTPISPEQLQQGLDNLFDYIDNAKQIALIKVAITHIEFEALHPFKDGNGRIGRMLIILMLWSLGLISKPHFYMSHYFEENKSLYIEAMRKVSKNNDWDAWCIFFFKAVEKQATSNLVIAENILELYEKMKILFSQSLSSKWSLQILDIIFTNPIFNNRNLTKIPRISKQSAARLTKILVKKELIEVFKESSGNRATLYKFEPLLKLVRI